MTGCFPQEINKHVFTTTIMPSKHVSTTTTMKPSKLKRQTARDTYQDVSPKAIKSVKLSESELVGWKSVQGNAIVSTMTKRQHTSNIFEKNRVRTATPLRENDQSLDIWALAKLLDAPSYLYKRLCPSVHLPVGPSFRDAFA